MKEKLKALGAWAIRNQGNFLRWVHALALLWIAYELSELNATIYSTEITIAGNLNDISQRVDHVTAQLDRIADYFLFK